MPSHISDTTTLYNGVKMPWLGLGVYKVNEGEEAVSAVKSAIKAGYRSIDTATLYANEEGVGRAIKESDVPREELFITTKVWNTDQGFESTLHAFDESLHKLGLDYVDLYLIHWPVKGLYKETWRALEEIYKAGRARSIGVSNFHIHHLKEVLADCEIIPMVNQVEYHPWLSQTRLHAFCKEHTIQLEAWSPLARGQLLEHPALVEIAKKHQKSTAQVILRWDVQNKVVTIPKSINEDRIRENADIFNFELSNEDMDTINSINENKRVGRDPSTFDE